MTNNPIVPVGGGQMPSTPQELADYYRRVAEAYAAEERAGGATISMKNGILSVGDQPIPGNQMAAIIVDAVHLNTWYPDKYDAQNPLPPRCYAVGRSDGEMRPDPAMAAHPEWFAPQSDACSTCPMNQWGSDPRGTGGKACTNRRRLVMIPVGTFQNGQWAITQDPEFYRASPLYTMTLPPTNIKVWGEFARGVAAQYQRPFFALVTRCFVHPNPKHGKENMGFEVMGPTPDDWAPAIFSRMQEAANEAFRGYDAPDQNRQQQPQRQAPMAGGGFYQQQAAPQAQGFPGWPQQG